MIHHFSKSAALTAAALLTCASATAAPVVIDSEQKANAAVITAQTAIGVPWRDLFVLSYYARGTAETAMRQLAAVTTPVAIINSRNGITVACSISGNLTARMARTFPRVLKLQWQACKFNDVNNNPHVRNGSAEVILLSDSLAPETVGGIRLGTANTDFTDTRHIDDPEQITDELYTVNMRLLGKIPMVRAFPLYGLFVGDFAFGLTGFYQLYTRADVVGSGQPVYEQTYRLSAESLVASGSVTYDTPKTHAVDELRLHFGTVTRESFSPNWGQSSSSFSVDGLKVRQESDYVAWSSANSVDGKIKFQFSPQSGCLSGEYALKTRAPLAGALSSGRYDSGELFINGSTTAKFFSAANVPPNLPVPQQGMLIHLDVRNVGSFNYDAPNTGILSQNSQCSGL